MMSELFDEQVQREQYDIASRKESEDRGIAIGRAKEKADTVRNMLALSTISLEDISKITGLTIETIKEIAVQGNFAVT